MPNLGTVKCTAVTANNPATQNIVTAIPATQLFAPFCFALDKLPFVRRNNGWMAVFNIVLRNFAFIDLRLFGEEINGKALLGVV